MGCTVVENEVELALRVKLHQPPNEANESRTVVPVDAFGGDFARLYVRRSDQVHHSVTLVLKGDASIAVRSRRRFRMLSLERLDAGFIIDGWPTSRQTIGRMGTAASKPSRRRFRVLSQERRRQLDAELEDAYKRDAADAAWREEVEAWDSTVGDGLNA